MKTDHEKLHQALLSCSCNPDINLEDIRRVLETARETFDLDVVFASSNREYKYQIDRLVTCEKSGKTDIGDTYIQLTEQEYRDVVKLYQEAPICDRAVDILKMEYDGSALHSAVLRGDEYYGSVCFYSKEKRTWSDAERTTLGRLVLLLLFYLSLIHLSTSDEKHEQLELRAKDDKVISCFHLDLTTGSCHAIKLSEYLQGYIGEWEDYSQVIEKYTEKFVGPVYGKRLLTRFSIEKLHAELNDQTRKLSLDFPRFLDGESHWLRFNAELLTANAKGEPQRALIVFEDMTDEARTSAFLAHDNDINQVDYTLVIGLDLITERYGVLVDERNEEMSDETSATCGNYRDVVELTAEKAIAPEYIDMFRMLFSFDGLRSHFERSQQTVRGDFPCTVNGTEYWIRIEAIPAIQYCETSKKIILYYTDITEWKKRDEALNMANESLRLEHERVMEARMQLLRDPLTNVYNRIGFDTITRDMRENGMPIGFMSFDVDHFKEINDNYGHEYGDVVLAQVTQQIKATFRAEDKLFRLGGNEFAMILPNCKNDAWNSIRSKIATVHRRLKKALGDESNVTLSVGLTLSGNGYNDNLKLLSDEALYHTKKNGRGGLTLVDANSHVVQEWNDQSMLHDENTDHPDLGNWRIEVSADGLLEKRLFIDETARIMLEIPESLSPEQCFDLFSSCLPAREKTLLGEIRDKATATGHVECVFAWNSPTQGEMMLRIGAKHRDHGGVSEIAGYVMVVPDSATLLSRIDEQFMMQAMSSLYYCSYYAEIESKRYYIIKGHETEPDVDALHYGIDETFREFIKTIVHPDFQQTVREFVDLDTLKDRMRGRKYLDCEYLTNSPFGWCKTRIMPVKWNDRGEVSHILCSSMSIDESERVRLERENKIKDALKLQLHISEVISKSTARECGFIDKKTGTITLWSAAKYDEYSTPRAFESIKTWALHNVVEIDRSFFAARFDLAKITESVDRDGSDSFTFRIREADSDKLTTLTMHFETHESDPSKLLMVTEDITDVIPDGIEWIGEFDILETMNEAVAIFDYDTHNIVFMNKLARDLTGLDIDQARNFKCYELFGDGDEPCSCCDSDAVIKGESRFMLKNVKGSEETLLVHGSAIRVNGRAYRLEQAIPASSLDNNLNRLNG